MDGWPASFAEPGLQTWASAINEQETSMSDEIRVVAILQAKPGQGAELERVLRAGVAPSRAEAGCLSYELHRDIDQEGRFVFVETWADRAAIETHRQMPHYKTMINAALEHVLERQVCLLSAIAVDSQPAL
ncbi:hypothetical protein C4K29_3229 [Pseudomonas chlororaphis subsp. piscium]|nr:hypothetical protein C4K29_3229 [Pseudomonas chlororaphis subsp. piscium]